MAYDITLDASNHAYLTGRAGGGFPTSPNAFQQNNRGWGDVFVVKLNPTGTQLVYSTYMGGDMPDVGNRIVVDAQGYA
ncbi:MAG: hypothetical protein ACUVRD_01465 [Bacteroidia bacterium]